MWIPTTESRRPVRLSLLCDECGAIFDAQGQHDPRSYWRMANIAGWARIARVPERHVCANC